MRGPRTRTTRLRVWLVGLACGLCLTAGCNAKPPQQAGGSSGSKADKARKDAEALALSAVNAGASAQAKAVPDTAVRRNSSWLGGRVTIDPEAWKASVSLNKSGAPAPAPPAPTAPVVAPVAPAAPVATAPGPRPRPGSPAVVRERVVSTVPYAAEAEAEEDALAQARELIERKLSELDPPVRYKPSVGEVRAEFIRKDTRTVRTPDAEERETFDRYGVTGNRVYVEYDVEVTAEQVRELRSQERSSAALRVLGILVAVALAGFLFLRADEWTKGYLTSWLAIAAVVLAGGAAAAFLFV